MSVELEVTGLIESLKRADPRIHQALTLLNQQVEFLTLQVEPLIQQSSIDGSGTAHILPPTQFVVASTGPRLRLTWTAAEGASQYEVRKAAVYNVNDWDTASFLFRTENLQADIDPILLGDHTYLIKSRDLDGNYSSTAAQANFTVPIFGPVSISAEVIDNNVLLRWNIEESTFNATFDIDYYLLKKDGVETGFVTSSFAAFFEAVSDTYIYSVIPVDVAGNVGTEATIEVKVNQPPDFALQDSRTSALGGTRVNVVLESGSKLLANWTTETFQNHFTSRVWSTPQNQVDAGYPIYIQPAATTGSYEEVIDYGTIINNIIVVITYTKNLITPLSDVTVVVKMAGSNDGSSYSAFTSGAAQFFAQFRYLKFRLEFTGADDKALSEFYEVKIDISVKRENDGGEITANSSDSGGTTVTFNKAFKDIETLTATVKSTTEPFITIIIFTDVPNPTDFKVMAFDTTGNRVTKVVEWKARGIV